MRHLRGPSRKELEASRGFRTTVQDPLPRGVTENIRAPVQSQVWAHSDDENAMNNAAAVPTSSETMNVMKSYAVS
ncbi:hypothetical protein TNCV_350451 [Trichonephila clavipes]|nr:hypothetical protein TNCV_350451 [Trichonephila clavipes]